MVPGSTGEIGHAVNQVILTGPIINQLRPAVIKFLQNEAFNTNRDNYGFRGIALAFNISPRDLGYDFETWNTFYEAESRVRYPSFAPAPPASN